MKGQRFTIGFRSEAWTPFCARQLAGILDYVSAQRDLTLLDLRYILRSGHADPHGQGDPPWTGRVDGMITGEGVENDPKETADWMMRGGVPVVNLGGDLIDPRIPIVLTSHDSVARLAAEHFIGLGLEHLAFVGFGLAHASALRARAFQRVLAERGLTARCCDVKYRYGGTDEEIGHENMEKDLIALLRSLPKPAGILALNDGTSLAICRLAQELGFGIPDDVAVLGVGDSELARTRHPALSSIRLPVEVIGRTAAKVLHDLLRGRPTPAGPVEIDALEVITRASTRIVDTRDSELDRAVDYLRNHACEGISVEDVLQTITMSRRLFEQLFAQRVGHAPGQELKRLRLERARQLLTETDFSVARIAEMTGYSEAAAFTRFFRQHEGRSPAAYRKGRALSRPASK